VVSPGYLPTLQVPLLRGRGFGENESPRSILLSQNLAHALWPDGRDAVGQTIRLGNGQPRNVVGVVGDVRQEGLGDAPTPTMYMPTTWLVTPTMTLVVRTAGDPAALVPAVRDAAQRAAPDLPLFDLQTLGGVVRSSVAEPRVQTSVLMAFALASLALAAFGVAGVVAYLVANRAPELAVRMALGAAPSRLVAFVLRGGLGLCALGIGGGALLLWALGRWRESLAPLFGSVGSEGTGVALALALSLLAAVGALACWLPARRVAAIAPNAALRDG